ncbi:MAG: 3-ketoacyl-ACP reductase [Lentisphaerae bacterium]|nr:3-ketoacyl-ACP reductase [Lentisphaerota bacterium]
MERPKTVLVTGGGRGIGAAIVEHLLDRGWDVAFCGRKPGSELAARVEALARRSGRRVRYVEADVAVRSDRERLLATVLAAFGALDALVNNAGVAPEVRADLLDLTEASYDRVMDTNLKGPFFLAQAVARHWAAGGAGGAIVNIGSISATVASVNRGEYCLSKAGIAMMTRLFAVRLAPLGINVYEVRPGVIASDMTAGVREKYDRLIAGGLTLQPRWGEPEDVGRAVAMLLAGDLAYSTGQVIQVDGGLEIQRL